jgi:ABC-type transporter Mla MlaB component
MSTLDGRTSRPARGARPVRAELVTLPADRTELVRLRGVLDERAIAVARETMCGALAHRPRLVIIDLKAVTRLDGAGLVLLAAMQQRASRAGSRMFIVDRRRSGPRLPRLPVHSTLGAALRAADRADRHDNSDRAGDCDRVGQGDRAGDIDWAVRAELADHAENCGLVRGLAGAPGR